VKEAHVDSCIRTSVEGGVATVTIARPPVNVLTLALLLELGGCLERLATVDDLRAIVLAAGGKHFSAGADVGEHLAPSYRELIPAFLHTLEAVASFPLPVIAAVRGRCLGGGFELVQMADMVVAGAGASFGQPEILLGVTAPAACAMLPRLTHRGMAAEILFTGEAIGAERALACGLVQRVVTDDRVEEEALSIARRCAGLSAAALRVTKRTLLAAAGLPLPEALRAAGAVYMDELMQTADAGEGLSAFVEKRAPVWRHR
jgi:cyclohexa-1,5-dienecarbonyl-CoA hydratase